MKLSFGTLNSCMMSAKTLDMNSLGHDWVMQMFFSSTVRALLVQSAIFTRLTSAPTGAYYCDAGSTVFRKALLTP